MTTHLADDVRRLPGAPRLGLGDYDLGPLGYVVEEWLLSGEAGSYTLSGPPRPDGRWDARPADRAPFTTRLVVVRPDDPAAFDGTVVVEWLNVSGSTDIPVEWLYGHRQMLRSGTAWVGVSVQRAGIEGGGLGSGDPATHLRQADPERYRELTHPGDAYAFDIFTHAVEAVRSAEPSPLGPLRPQTVLAAGASQSASLLVTYLNAVDPLVQAVDGVLLHGRGAQGGWLDGVLWDPGRMVREAAQRARPVSGHRVRDDVRVPVLVVQAETDLAVMGSVFARQPDTELFRLWEVAGASHFDSYGLTAAHLDDGTRSPEELYEALRPVSDPHGVRTTSPINSGPQLHFVMNSALGHLARWVRDGSTPPVAEPLHTKRLRPLLRARDRWGLAGGGVRSPWVDAPVARLSGTGQRVAGFGLLFGTTQPFPPDVLGRRYPGGKAQYDQEFAEAAARAVGAGHMCQDDLEEILALGSLGWPEGAGQDR
jgi:hypothetical protein